MNDPADIRFAPSRPNPPFLLSAMLLPVLSALSLMALAPGLQGQDGLWDYDPDELRGFPAGAERLDLFPVNIDFYYNDLSFAIDDTVEADYSAHNIRVYRNLCYNTHTALSVQPSYGGPVYLVRNVAHGITGISYKWNNHPSGVLAYHNTTLSGASGFSSPLWSNGHLRNNLILGAGAKISTGTFTPERSTLDYNGYAGGAIRWTEERSGRTEYPDLAAFAAARDHERHGIEIGFDVFRDAAPVERGRSYEPSDFDLRLAPGSNPVDAGTRLPNINDDHLGAAPDLGAYELGAPAPHCGPREGGPGFVRPGGADR